MSNPPPTVLQLARQGDPEAIAALMNRHLEAQGITAHVVQHDSTLQVNLEAAQIPNQADLVAYVKKGITGLELANVQQLTVSGKQLGADASAWSENLVLQATALDDLDFDLGLDAAPASDDLDLGLDLDSPSLDLEDLGFDAALDDNFSGADLDLELSDSPSDLSFEAPADFDLSFADSPSDSDFDLTDAGLTAGGDLEAADALNLDTDPSASADDLDFDLDLGEASGEPAAADLGTDLDFDLGFPEPAADFDLDLADAAAAPLGETPDPAELDFDLGFEEAPASAPDDLGFDLDLLDTPPEGVSTSDFDLDLAMGDLATGNVTEAPGEDLDLALESNSLASAGASTDLDFDLGEAEPLTTDALDLDLGPEDATVVDREIDFDLGSDTSDLDLDFAAADQAALDLEAQQWAADSGAEDLVDFDSSLGLGEAAGDEGAIAANDLDFDLNVPAAPPTAPDVDLELDDLWSSSDASPDLGMAPAASADSTAAPWATDLSAMDDLNNLDADLGSEANLSDDFTNLEPIASDLDFPELKPDPLAATEFDTGLDLELDAGFDPEAPLVEDSTSDAYGFPDLDLGVDSTDSNLEAGLEPLSPELLPSEELPFEDLGAAADLDLADPAAFAGGDWATEEPNLAIDADLDVDADLGTYDDLGNYGDLGTADTDLGTYSDLGTADFAAADADLGNYGDLGTTDTDLGIYDDLGAADFAAVDLDLVEGDLNDAAVGTPFSSDFDLEGADEELSLESPSSDTFAPEESDLSYSEATAPPWAAADSGFDPDLVLDSPADFGTEPDSAFDPGLVFDAPAEDPYNNPNPFMTESYGMGYEADADMPFSTMELDQTVGDEFMADPAIASEPSDAAAPLLEQPEDHSARVVPATDLEFGNDIPEDPAFESVEFGNDAYETPGFEAARFGDADLDTDFGSTDFDEEGFDGSAFNDSSLDSNGFIQDRNGVALADDEPDATDDFIQEFGSDPSTHVSLTPDQFNDDGSVRRSGGGSGLPMRLILGLGLGALALALVGLLLNGLLGRLRPPTPGGDPAVTEPAVPPPVDPASVPAEDLFRQAVNAAQTAANQAQTASTPAQWQEVADTWARAIDLMQRVPDSDPNYATAQQKAIDYQPNLDYARQNAQ